MSTLWHWLQIRRYRRFTGPSVPNKTLYGVNTFEPPYLVSHANVIATAQSLGVTVIRCGLTWSNMQTTVGGSITWTEYDSIYSKCLAAGITPLFVIETTSLAYNTQPHGFFATAPGLNAVPPVTDPTYFPLWVSDQTNWAVGVVQRYPRALFEIGNEWATAGEGWQENNSNIAKPTVSAYGTYFMSAYAAMKAAVPSATIAVGGLTAVTQWGGSNATTGVNVVPLLTGISGFQCDAWSIHPYTHNASDPNPSIDNFPTNNSFDDIGRFQTAMINNGQGSVPLWVTEWGDYSAAAISGGEATKATYVTNSLSYIRTRYGLGAVGTGKAGVTIATIFPMIDSAFAPTDTGLVGPAGNGPYTYHTSATAYQSFVQSLGTIPRLVTVSPSTFTVTAGSTQQLTVVVKDQFGNTIGSPSITWSSSATGVATVSSSGLVTGVSAGSVTITATSGAVSGTASGTVTTAAPTINYTTGQYIMNSNGAVPVWFEHAGRYTGAIAGDAGFRTQIANYGQTPGNALVVYSDLTKVGTAPNNATAKYNDGGQPDLIVWQNSEVSEVDGTPLFKCRIVGRAIDDESTPPEIRGPLPGTLVDVWVARRARHGSIATPWSDVGDVTNNSGCAVTYNTGGTCSGGTVGPPGGGTLYNPQAAAFKEGPWLGYSNIGSGRAGISTTNGTGNTADISLAFNAIVSGSTYGIADVNVGSIVNEWVDGHEYDYLFRFRSTLAGSTVTTYGTMYRKKARDPNSSYAKVGTTQIGTPTITIPQPVFGTIELTSKNYNQSRVTDLYWYLSCGAVWDATNPNNDGSDNPFGVSYP